MGCSTEWVMLGVQVGVAVWEFGEPKCQIEQRTLTQYTEIRCVTTHTTDLLSPNDLMHQRNVVSSPTALLKTQLVMSTSLLWCVN